LVADDSKRLRTVLRTLLEQHANWSVCAEAEDGRQAVSKAVDVKPTLVLLDWKMPVMDGLEAARQIGRVLPAVPILMFTIDDVLIVEREAKKSGVGQVVSKTDSVAMVRAIEELTAPSR